jgi:eukaryotic-like serine/threonine-protein kinase
MTDRWPSSTTAAMVPAGYTHLLLLSRYELGPLLGEGGMAEVFAGLDLVLDRPVAVKLMRAGLARDPHAVARFRREARAVASLAHPNVVGIHDVGELDGRPFIVMELVAGEPLSQVVVRDGPLSPGRVAEIGEAVAAALAFAHAAGIVHRDVKSSNVIVTPWGHVKVLDFGIARAASWTPITDGERVHGTAEYLSPEQARGDELDGRSDLYSLGVVLYELLTGRVPFTGENSVAIALRHLDERPAPIWGLRPGVPAGLEAIVMRCLQKEPDRRYQSAGQLRADLRAFLVSAPPATASLPAHPRTDVLPEQSRGRRSTRNERPRTSAAPGGPPRGAAVHRRHARGGLVGGLAWLATLGVLIVLGLVLLTGPGSTPPGDPAEAAAPPPPLAAPTELRADAICDGFLSGQITVTWEASTSWSVDGYVVFRSLGPGEPFVRVAVLEGRGTTTHVDRELEAGTQAFYTVQAKDGARLSAQTPVATTAVPALCF